MVGNDGRTGFESLQARGQLPVRDTWVGSAHVAQDVNHVFFVKELQNAGTEVVEMLGLGSQVNRLGIRLERVEHARR